MSLTKTRFKQRLTKTKFKKWLQSKKPNSIIGIARYACDCPIAFYLENVNSRSITVCYDAYYETTPLSPIFYSLPLWAIKFIDKIDEAPMGHKISAKKALTILEQIK